MRQVADLRDQMVVGLGRRAAAPCCPSPSQSAVAAATARLRRVGGRASRARPAPRRGPPSEASKPERSEPAIGWPPTKLTSGRAGHPRAASTTLRLTLPASVRTAPGRRCGHAARISPGSAPTGAHRTTRPAPATPVGEIGGAASAAPASSTARIAASWRATTTTSRASRRPRSPRATEPPMRPGLTTVTRPQRGALTRSRPPCRGPPGARRPAERSPRACRR